MTADRMQQAMPWLLGVTIVVFGEMVALVLIGRAYAPDHIHQAAENGNVVLVRWFVLVRPDLLDARDAHGNTPLHRAARGGDASVADALLAAGADANAKDTEGGTPLHWAADGGDADVVKALLTAGADVNAKDAKGQTPLHWAAHWGRADVVKTLLTAGADANAKDARDWTPLHQAAEGGDTSVVDALLTAGADANAKTDVGQTPLDWANIMRTVFDDMQAEWDDVIELLERHGAQHGVDEAR